MLVSYIPGRVRIRANAFKAQENVDTLLMLSKTVDGITSITPNLKTGGVLITYDTEVVDEGMLLTAMDMFQSTFGEEETSPKKSCAKPFNLLDRKEELAALTATFGMTVGSLFFGRRWHALAGLAFTLLSIKHMVDRKNQF